MDTVLHRLNAWANETPGMVAQRIKEGTKKEGVWKDISAQEFRNRVLYTALYLESNGFKKGDIGAIYAYNSPQWVHLELAFTLVQGLSAGLYPNSTQNDIQYIIKHTQAKILGVQDKKYFSKMGEVPACVEKIIVFDNDTTFSPRAIAYKDMLIEGEKLAKNRKFEDYLNKIDAKEGAYLIYTSGTTGEPKGAILSQDNLAFTSDATMKHWNIERSCGNLFSFLPLCHIAEKLQNIGVGLTCRLPVSFCTRMEYLTIELQEVQPSMLLCVPRVWEKIMEGVQSKLNKAKGMQKLLATWSFATGRRVMAKAYKGKWINPLDSLLYEIADKLVLSKIKKAVGLSRITKCASGAAALPTHVSKWYQSLGLEILQDFGQTESTGVVCMTQVGVESSGTVGVPVVGTELKLEKDGEILTRGRHVFIGYLKNDASTKEVLDSNGWLHTGDLGEFNNQGQLVIKGRKKEVMKSSGGKMVAPLPIEDKIKTADFISQVCIVGDGRKYFSALVTLSEQLLNEIRDTTSAASDLVVKDPGVVTKVKKQIDDVNRSLASYEKIKHFTVLSRDFSIEEGEMTPTMKMKRGVIESHFKDLIDQMYTLSGGDE